MKLEEYSNAAAVDLTAIPSDIYGIIAKILLREAAKQSESGDNITLSAVADERRVELW